MNKTKEKILVKKIFKNIIEVLSDTLVTTGEFGLMLFGLSILWIMGKLEFFIAIGFIGIFMVVDKIMDSRKSGE